MQYFMKIGELDTLPLMLALRRQPELFGVYNERKQRVGDTNGPHAAMTDIWVRHNDRRPFERGDRPWSEFNDEHDPVWYPASDKLPEVRDLIFGVMARVRGERLGGVLITKLPAGEAIEPHIDTGWHAGYYDKYMVHLQAEAGTEFRFPDGVMRARSGEVWWFRNDIPHSIHNGSEHDRLVLIISIKHSKGAAWTA